jgi:GntR family transcriptional regulator
MPPIRALAEQLLINPNTVARAYRELEVAGILTKRGTTGTYVSATPASKLMRRERVKILAQRADALLAEANHLGITVDEVIDLLRQREEKMQGA